jgi:hypothetical protein
VLDLVQAAGADGDPRDVFEMIEGFLQSESAAVIEQKTVASDTQSDVRIYAND